MPPTEPPSSSHPGSHSSRISRRNFFKVSIVTAAAFSTSGKDDSPLPIDSTPIAPPDNVRLDLKAEYAKAYKELDEAALDTGKEFYTVISSYDIFDSSKLMKGADVTIIPAGGKHEGHISFALKAAPDKPRALPASSRLLGVMLKIAALNEQSRQPGAEATPLDYEAITNRIIKAYNSRAAGNGIEDDNGWRWVIKSSLADITDACINYTRPPFSRHDLQLMEARFKEALEKYKNYTTAGYGYMSTSSRTITLSFMKNPNPKEGEKFEVMDCTVVIPDAAVLEAIKASSTANATEKKIADMLLDRTAAKPNPALPQQNLDLSTAIRTLFGIKVVPITITLKNPTLHQNQEEARRLNQAAQGRKIKP